MEPTRALFVIENSLRALVRDVLPNWEEMIGDRTINRATKAQENERESRDGVETDGDLLDFTYTASLVRLVLDNWESFAPVLGSEEVTRGFLTFTQDVRNAPAHSRDLLPFERDLLSGVAGRIQNQIALWRAREDSPTRYYPRIESIVDQFGRSGGDPRTSILSTGLDVAPRLEVGQDVTLTMSAYAARGFQPEWRAAFVSSPHQPLYGLGTSIPFVTGNPAALVYTVKPEDVGEAMFLAVVLRTASRYTRYSEGFDDVRVFEFQITPPMNEIVESSWSLDAPTGD